jgi:hypothetical protein
MPLLTYCAVAGRSYLRVASSNSRRLATFGLGLALALGCAAGTKPNVTGGGGQNPIAGIGGTGGKVGPITGLGGGLGLAGTIGSGGANPDAKSCMEYAVQFKAKTPTVVILVDRSTSMFPCLGSSDLKKICPQHENTSWERLHASMLQVVDTLQADVRFGFVSYTGVAGKTCPMLNKVAPALNNKAAIEALYASLPWPTDTDKWETPTAQSLTSVGADLMADTTDGDKYILLATDGAPDYCDDGNSLCPPDAVVGNLQTLKAAGITTIVFGLQSAVNDLPTTTLQAFANAGAGEATLPPLRNMTNATVNDFWDQCNADAHWKAEIVAKFPECMDSANFNTCRGKTVGTYDTTKGPAKPFVPDAKDQTMLVAQLSSALAGVKSCSFDLGGHVMVNTQRLNEAVIKIDGTVIPLDPNNGNGWNMSTPTQLELHGGACDTWRGTGTDIHFGFPCDIIVD